MQLFFRTIQYLKNELNHFFAPENMKKPPSKVAHNRPSIFFQYSQPAQNQPKSHFLFHKNVSLHNFYTMTLLLTTDIHLGHWAVTLSLLSFLDCSNTRILLFQITESWILNSNSKRGFIGGGSKVINPKYYKNSYESCAFLSIGRLDVRSVLTKRSTWALKCIF